jgi:hypothetical protein
VHLADADANANGDTYADAWFADTDAFGNANADWDTGA